MGFVDTFLTANMTVPGPCWYGLGCMSADAQTFSPLTSSDHVRLSSSSKAALTSLIALRGAKVSGMVMPMSLA